MRRAALRRRAGGSAAVEFVTLAPFVLILSALLWDLRAYVSHRTDLAREVHVVAELIAAEADASPLVPSTNPLTARFLDAFMDRFAARGAGSIDVAVVARGTTRRNGAPCPPFDPGDPAASWCPPQVYARWPATAADGRWAAAGGGAAGGNCALSASGLPASGAVLPVPDAARTCADTPPDPACMLPAEDAGPGTEDEWVSRRLRDDEWWVVVDVCLHPGAGTFTGPLIAAGMNAMDFGSFVSMHRAAWRSLHERGTCLWCGF